MKNIMKPFISKAGKRLATIVLFSSVFAPASLPTTYAAVQSQLKIGDSYGGGKIAYIFSQKERGYVAGQTHGLIAAKNDLGFSDTWAKTVKACKDYRVGGFSDWHLPNKEELNRLYVNRMAIGGFKEHHYYWSSSESDRNDAWDQSFRTGSRNLGYKFDTEYARPVRRF